MDHKQTALTLRILASGYSDGGLLQLRDGVLEAKRIKPHEWAMNKAFEAWELAIHAELAWRAQSVTNPVTNAGALG